MGKSHDIVIKMLRVEKVGMLSLSERICGLKLVQIVPRSTSEKRIMLDYQYRLLPTDSSFIGQGRAYNFL